MERRGGTEWKLASQSHLGIEVPYAMHDARTNTVWASLQHGHWGPKLARSRDAGITWQDVPTPTYPEGSELKAGVPASLKFIWVIAPGGNDEPARMYLG